MKLSISLFFLVLVFGNLSAQGNKKFPPEKIREDLAIVKRVVYDIHPRPFQWHSKDSFDIWFQEAEQKIQGPMTELEFQQLIFKIYKKIGCGHSRVMSTQSVAKQASRDYNRGMERSILPFKFYAFGDSLFVAKYFNKDSLIHRGDRILSIDERPVKELIQTFSGFITSDGYNETHIEDGINRNFGTYYHRFFPYDNDYQIEFIDSLGQQKSLLIPGYVQSKKLAKSRKKEKKKNPPPPPKSKNKFTTIYKKGGYKFSRATKDTTLAILRIPKFAGKEGRKFYKKVFKEIEKDSSIKALAVDLRQNGGGDARESFMLCQILNTDSTHFELKRRRHLDREVTKYFSVKNWMITLGRLFISSQGKASKNDQYYTLKIDLPRHKRFNYEGPLYVLTDGYSFSASSVLGSFLKDTGRATFIGEETGGGYHGTNAMQSPNLILPNTTVRLRVPLWSLDQLVSAPIEGRGIFPDYPTEWDSHKAFGDLDLEMEVLYRLLEEKRSKDLGI